MMDLRKNMKMIKLLSVLVCASFVMASASFAADAPAKKCCEPVKTIADQKNCACDCCKKAAEKSKWCKKCHPQAKKAPAKTPAKS
jgi:hypothetical protein